ncbi:hypothetical protein RHRU231_420118 [Rhodococcus ruber]|uniref:Uncharacterized protein n=1 Tax=Rhodococcus ruber TaxID=1830 RepID=A0A098BIN7_9NOCA|nr:hypothetical protein RHRU231_420118 [Rhodococcus ruber]
MQSRGAATDLGRLLGFALAGRSLGVLGLVVALRAEQLGGVDRGATGVGDGRAVDDAAEGLAATDVSVDGAQLVRLADLLDELLRRNPVALRLEEDALGELFLLDGGAFGLGNRVEQQLHLHGALGGLTGVLVELLAARALLFEELVELGLVVIERVDGVVQGAVDLGLDDGLGQRHLDRLEQHVENLVADLTGLLDLLDPGDPLAQVRLELVEGVELARELGELVVLGGQLALLDTVHRDGDDGLVAGMVTGDQRGGELLRLARGHADERLVEAVDELTRPHLVGQTGGGGLGDRLAADGRGQIDGHEVTVLHRTLDTGEGAETLTQRQQLLLDRLVGDLHGIDGDLDGGEVGQGDLGPDIHLGGEDELDVVLELGDVDLGLAEDLDLVGGHCLAVAGRDGVVDDLLEHGAPPDAGLEQLARSLTRPEAGQSDLAGECLERAVEIRLELLEGHLNVDTDSRRAELLDGALHGHAPSVVLVCRSVRARVSFDQAVTGCAVFHPVLPGRDDRIRTCDPPLPKRMRYQAAPHPVNTGTRNLPGTRGRILRPPDYEIQSEVRYSLFLHAADPETRVDRMHGDVAQW